MRIATLLMAIIGAATAAIWVDRSASSARRARSLPPKGKPEHIQEWEGEGGALQLSGAHFSPPIEPAIQPDAPELQRPV